MVNGVNSGEKPEKSRVEIIKEKIYKAKVVEAYERAVQREASITDKLNSLLSDYFDNYFDFEDELDARYKKLNKEWKEYCYKVKLLKKNIPLQINAFEVEVSEIIEKNPQFKSNKI